MQVPCGTDDFYNGYLIQITGGTGVGQLKKITDYNGTTKVATVESDWDTNPANDSVFNIYEANVTIYGDISITGKTTAITSTNTTVSDTLFKLANGSITSTNDIGLILTRGNGTNSNTANVGFIWDESDDIFALIACNTEDGTTAGDITIDSYKSLDVAALRHPLSSLKIEGNHGLDINTETNINDNLNLFGNLVVTGQTVDIDAADAITIDALGTLGITSANTALTVASGTGALNISNDATNTTVNVGTGGGVKTCTFGSTNSTSATTFQTGSGAMTFTAGGNYDVNATGTVSIDGGSGIDIGVASDVAVDIDAAAFTLDASGTLGITSANTALTVASGTGALNISADAANTTVNVGTGGGVKTCTFGSTNTTSATTIQTGSGAYDFYCLVVIMM